MIDKSATHKTTEKATFAGGCFWCMEPPFKNIEGIRDVISGYTGGATEDPTYEEVSSGSTGHAEAVQIIFDPSRVSYSELLDIFWKQIDPTDAEGQFADRGSQYRTAIFYHSEEQKKLAEESRKNLIRSGKYGKPIVTEILPVSDFYRAEDDHQDYYKKHSLHYKLYRSGSGRDQYLNNMWKSNTKTENSSTIETPARKPSERELRNTLTPLQFRVTQENGTEPAFDNEYWDNKREGIYVDIVSGEPLFSSTDKFDSKTGWPSFFKTLETENIAEKKDRSLFMERIEVRSKEADSHLGHVFDDGPPPTGRRYCINSAAIRFIPKEDLEKEGYAQYLKLFDK